LEQITPGLGSSLFRGSEFTVRSSDKELLLVSTIAPVGGSTRQIHHYPLSPWDEGLNTREPKMHKGRTATPIYAANPPKADKTITALVEKQGKYSFLPRGHPVTIQGS
jgi:hypothetical protein